ncbi:hypothetical protein BT63DRAFT_103633 [Microthyrium microscopicum]|uniref:Uncharacterized protein n=1 Tax=Microthyrium microscopicum TaxID=703497 RepID=A0A6A6TXZ8_9PEZI|nr:hypothetical protein BT63DRAFT_103633 [Microthyrium microscopicum]
MPIVPPKSRRSLCPQQSCLVYSVAAAQACRCESVRPFVHVAFSRKSLPSLHQTPPKLQPFPSTAHRSISPSMYIHLVSLSA